MYCLCIFKAEWCGHCQNFLNNEFNVNNGIKSYLDNNKKFYSYKIIDADKDKNLIETANIEGFPTIRLYTVMQEGGGKKKSINLKEPVYEFDRRDKTYVKTVLDTLKNKKSNKGGRMIEKFTPETNFSDIKASYQVKHYVNNNGRISGKSANVICYDGKCKYENKIMNEDGTVKVQKDVLPYNYDNMDNFTYNYYNNLLDLQTNY